MTPRAEAMVDWCHEHRGPVANCAAGCLDTLYERIEVVPAADLAREREARERAEREQKELEGAYRSDIEAVFDAIRDHSDVHGSLESFVRHRLGTFGQQYDREGFAEVVAERDQALARAEKAENECEQVRAERDILRDEREQLHRASYEMADERDRFSTDLADAVEVVKEIGRYTIGVDRYPLGEINRRVMALLDRLEGK